MTCEMINIEKICRTCLSETAVMRPLFSPENINDNIVKLSEMLSSCTSLEITENDGLPEQICLKCVNSMLASFSFKRQCCKSDHTLRDLLSKRVQSIFVKLNSSDSLLDVMKIIQLSSLLGSNEDNTIQELDGETNKLDKIQLKQEKMELIHDELQSVDIKKDIINCGFEHESSMPSKNTILVSENNEVVNFKNELENDDGGKIKEEIIDVDEDKMNLHVCAFLECFSCFTTEDDLKKHQETHQSSRPATHLCKICNRAFGNYSSLCRHMSQVHNIRKKYTCSECDKTFTKLYNLKEHSRVHKNKFFVCTICDKGFDRPTSLHKHKMSHSEEKPYVCNVCNNNFKNKSHLKYHLMRHRDEQPYRCPHCDLGCVTPNHLTTHIKIHEKPYSCNMCSKSFSSGVEFNAHMKSHK